VQSKKPVNKWKAYLRKDLIDSAYDLGATITELKIRGFNYWVGIGRTFLFGKKKESRFKDELRELLDKKFHETSSLRISEQIFSRMCKELHDLLLCSLASQRSPDEIIDGLQGDSEMREEVIDLIISKVARKTFVKQQRIFLGRIFSGDPDLRRLLKAQKEKKGFPHNI